MEKEEEGFFEALGENALLLLKVAVIIAAAFVLERSIRILLKRFYLRSDKGHEDRTRYRFLRNGTRFIVGLIALATIIYSIPSFKHVAVTLFAGAGILVAILGFAAQGAFSNIISGVFIVSFKPFRVGDWLNIGSLGGTVEDITLRHTVLVTGENRRVIIPNSKISDETIINSTIIDPSICGYIEVRVSHESDLTKAMRVLQEECEQHPDCIDRRTPEEVKAGTPKVTVRVVVMNEWGLTLRAYAWAADPTLARMMRYDVNRSVKLAFDRAGISMPYAQRTITTQQSPPAE
jgi:small-conductance mechanosensitive channel